MRFTVPLPLVACLVFQSFVYQNRSGFQTPTGAKQQGPKHHLAAGKGLQQFFAKRGYVDPALPALIHAFRRLLAGSQNANQLDRVVQDNLTKYRIDRNRIEAIVKNWDSISPQIKAQLFRKEFLNLDTRQPVDLKLLGSLINEAAARFQPKRGASAIPLNPKLPGVRPAPQITSVRTSGLDFALVLRPGEEFTLLGRNFSAMVSQDVIQIGHESAGAGAVTFDVLQELTPTSASTTELRAIAPRTLTPGSNYRVRVVVNGIRSNVWSAYVETPPPPGARLDGVSPSACQFPGQRVLLQGDNFRADSVVQYESLDVDGIHEYRSGAPSVEFVSPHEVYFRIPQETWPGDYALAVLNPGSSLSGHQTLSVCTPSYSIDLEEIHCIDESDAEWPGDDEVAVTFGGKPDNRPWVVTATAEFEGFSDGTRRHFDAVRLFADSTTPAPVGQLLVLQYMLVEVDTYDRAGLIALVSALGGIADGIAAIVGALAAATAVTIGAVTGGIGIIVGVIIVAILLDSNPPDLIGGNFEAFNAPDLQQRTAAGGSSFTQTAEFRNDDDTGSYQLTYRVNRAR